jgi:hypothetical protein
MEVAIVLLLALLCAVIAGSATYLGRQLQGPRLANPGLDALRQELDARHDAEIERFRGELHVVLTALDGELKRLREGLREMHDEHHTRLVALRDRVAEVDTQTLSALDRAIGDVRSTHEVELAQMRESLASALSAVSNDSRRSGFDPTAGRRADAIANLDQRLARLESAFVSVTNPLLLPGEPYTLPAELPAEALKWESWKEIGDAAFAFAQEFGAERIHLDDETCRDLTAFVTALREQLTRTIYPTLANGGVSDDPVMTLRESCEQIGADIPAARSRLRVAYAEIAS